MALLMVLSSAASAQTATDGLVVCGVGSSGNWTSSVGLVNPGASALSFFIIPRAVPFGCPGGCPRIAFRIQPDSAFNLQVEDLVGDSQPGLHTLFIVPLAGSQMPIARAHAMTANSGQGAEFPVFRASSILSRPDPGSLHFPAATRDAVTHTNLLLTAFNATALLGSQFDPSEAVPFTARIELVDSQGLVRGTMVASNCGADPYCPDLFLIDVVKQLGIDEIENGQIRVTRLSGDGAIWGYSAIVSTKGLVSVVPGWNP